MQCLGNTKLRLLPSPSILPIGTRHVHSCVPLMTLSLHLKLQSNQDLLRICGLLSLSYYLTDSLELPGSLSNRSFGI